MSLYRTPSVLEASLLGLKSHSDHNRPITERKKSERGETDGGGGGRGGGGEGQTLRGNPVEQKQLASVFID